MTTENIENTESTENTENNQSPNNSWSTLFEITRGVLQSNPDDSTLFNGYVAINNTHPLFGKTIEEIIDALNNANIFFVGDTLAFMQDITGFYWVGFTGTDQDTTSSQIYALANQLTAMYGE